MHKHLVNTINPLISAALTLKWCLRAYSENLWKMLFVEKKKKGNSPSRIETLYHFVVVFVLLWVVSKNEIAD